MEAAYDFFEKAMKNPRTLGRLLVGFIVAEAILWFILVVPETNGLKPYIGQQGVLVLGAFILIGAVLVALTAVVFSVRLLVLLYRNRSAAQDVARSKE